MCRTTISSKDFRPLIEEAELSIVFVSGGQSVRTQEFRMYFIGITRRGDTPPAWASR